MPSDDDKPQSRLSLPVFQEHRKSEWWELVDHDEAAAHWAKSRDAVAAAWEYHQKRDRPLEILAIHGSGRHPMRSCAHELSNSQMILEAGLAPVEHRSDTNIERVLLRELHIEHCNGCVSTSSAHCGWPCDCHPHDDMHGIYEQIIKCDVLLLSTGVNQSNMSSRLKAMLDRLVSADGGFARTELPIKDAEFRSRTVALGASHEFTYDQRMFGRAAAYFISSKDHDNQLDLLQGDTHPPAMAYGDFVAHQLLDSQRDYGFHHADDWYVVGSANPDVDYSYDKQHYSEDTQLHQRAQAVVQAAIDLAEQLRADPPEFDGGARVNRT